MSSELYCDTTENGFYYDCTTDCLRLTKTGREGILTMKPDTKIAKLKDPQFQRLERLVTRYVREELARLAKEGVRCGRQRKDLIQLDDLLYLSKMENQSTPAAPFNILPSLIAEGVLVPAISTPVLAQRGAAESHRRKKFSYNTYVFAACIAEFLQDADLVETRAKLPTCHQDGALVCLLGKLFEYLRESISPSWGIIIPEDSHHLIKKWLKRKKIVRFTEWRQPAFVPGGGGSVRDTITGRNL